jgi:TolB-like protein/DNA-binding winged helix-turn-helix (wHTH) protein
VSPPVFTFGDFRLDAGRFELSRDGHALKLERKPMELLLLLVQANGNLAPRAEIARRLWDTEVYVDTEHGINTAIRKIRSVLGDDPDSPRFIQTVPGMGYRFIAPIAVENPAPFAEQPSTPFAAPPASPAVPTNSTSHPRSSNTRWLIAAAGLVLVTAFLWLFGWQTAAARLPHRHPSSISSIAVLPIDNLSGDAAQDYFADGMTDELITRLARDSTLRITSRTSVMQYKKAHLSLPEIAQALKVDAILEGSVRHDGKQTHLTLQLIQADTDTHLWADSYDRESDDSTLPDVAARAIAARLNRTVSALPPVLPINPVAHDDYLRGHYLWTVGRNSESATYFRKAVALQPDYAAGWAGLSEYLNVEAMYTGKDPSEQLAEADAAARKAVELDSSLAQGHTVLAAALLFDHWDANGALKELDRAIELEPENGQAYHLKAKILCALDRFDEANQAQALATAANPFEHPGSRAEIFGCTRQYQAAIQDAQLRLRDFPTSADVLAALAAAYEGSGQEREAAEIRFRQFNAEGLSQLAKTAQKAFAQSGYRGIVQTELAIFETWHYSPVERARLNARLGHADKAIALLNEATSMHAPLLAFRLNNPDFDSLHRDPRFRAIAQKVGLPYAPPSKN